MKEMKTRFELECMEIYKENLIVISEQLEQIHKDLFMKNLLTMMENEYVDVADRQKMLVKYVKESGLIDE